MDVRSPTDRDAMESERVRLLQAKAEADARKAEADAKLADIDRRLREIAELERLAASLNYRLVPAGPSAPAGIQSLGELMHEYRNSALSPFKALRFSTRRYYNTLMKRFDEHASVRLDALDEGYIRRMHDEWTDRGSKNTQMGRSLKDMLQRLLKYGAHTLKNQTCAGAVLVMQGMDFPVRRGKREELSEKDANSIIQRANEIGRSSIGLAQALQFALALHQKDVIGEWVPETDTNSPVSDIIFEGKKWIRGLRWEDIDSEWVLRHTTSQGSRRVEEDLNLHPLVRRELRARIGADGKLPQRGPVILCETTRRPWIANEFRRWWRKVANDVGIKSSVKNAASRKKNSRVKESRADLLILGRTADVLAR